jgi:hydrogenase maturation protease
VLGLGSSLRGDDGVGGAVVKALREAGVNGAWVDLVNGGTPGLEIVLLLEGYARAIVVDAADMGLEAGAWRRFTPDEVSLATGTAMRGTLHDAGLFEALALAEALGMLPAELVIFGIQPCTVGWEPGLTSPVEQAVPDLCAAIIEELNGV